MGFFKKLIVDLKEQERLKKESFIYSMYLENIKEREVWKDQKIISILKEAQSDLWNIAHIASQPTKELTTN